MDCHKSHTMRTNGAKQCASWVSQSNFDFRANVSNILSIYLYKELCVKVTKVKKYAIRLNKYWMVTIFHQ